ncbi:MAG: hypothetical protein ACTJGF_02110 [Corynebacterium sp.]
MSSTPDPQRDTESSKQQASAEERFAALEARVEALENAASKTSEANGFWVVDALHNQREQMPEGSVIFGGDVDAAGGSYSYQWQRPLEVLTDPDMWTDSFERLFALAHPVRGAILRLRSLSSSKKNWSHPHRRHITIYLHSPKLAGLKNPVQAPMRLRQLGSFRF